MWDSIAYKREDGTFIAVVDGRADYHVTADHPNFAQAQIEGANAPDEPPFVLPEPPALPATEEGVRMEADRRISLIAPQYLAGERGTFPVQRAELAAFDADNNATTPYIDALAAGRGETRAQAANRIRANATAFENASAHIIGKQVALLAMDPIPSDFAADSWWT